MGWTGAVVAWVSVVCSCRLSVGVARPVCMDAHVIVLCVLCVYLCTYNCSVPAFITMCAYVQQARVMCLNLVAFVCVCTVTKKCPFTHILVMCK